MDTDKVLVHRRLFRTVLEEIEKAGTLISIAYEQLETMHEYDNLDGKVPPVMTKYQIAALLETTEYFLMEKISHLETLAAA
jgi:hypothetical protein